MRTSAFSLIPEISVFGDKFDKFTFGDKFNFCDNFGDKLNFGDKFNFGNNFGDKINFVDKFNFGNNFGDKFSWSKCSEMNGRSKAAHPPPPHRPVPVIPPSVKPRVMAAAVETTTTPEKKFSNIGSKPKARPRIRNDASSTEKNATQGWVNIRADRKSPVR